MGRTAAELTNVDDPVWPQIRDAIDKAPVTVEVLPVSPHEGERVIEQLQVSTRSVLGALALECGGLLVDHGWLRLLGGGSDGVPDVATASGIEPGSDIAPPLLMVGYDVLGGRFAIDGGGLGIAPGQVCYFAPDSPAWSGLDIGHGDFVGAMLNGATNKFYELFRWPGWEDECAALAPDQGFSIYPPPFSQEGKDLANVDRRPVPLVELFAFYEDAGRQLGSAD